MRASQQDAWPKSGKSGFGGSSCSHNSRAVVVRIASAEFRAAGMYHSNGIRRRCGRPRSKNTPIKVPGCCNGAQHSEPSGKIVVPAVVSPQQFHRLAINYMTHPIHRQGTVCFHPGVGRASMSRVSWRSHLHRRGSPPERAMPCRDGVPRKGRGFVGGVGLLRNPSTHFAAEPQPGYGAITAGDCRSARRRLTHPTVTNMLCRMG